MDSLVAVVSFNFQVVTLEMINELYVCVEELNYKEYTWTDSLSLKWPQIAYHLI